MSNSGQQFILDVLSGRETGFPGGVLRTALGCAEPFYAAAMTVRNRLYDRRLLGATRLPVPVISVGNITAGGTGKTPVVRWLAEHLRAAGFHPAILMRGYKRPDQHLPGDEQALLRLYLNDELAAHEPGPGPCAECQATPIQPVLVHAQADRIAGGRAVLRQQPQVQVLILDDGLQHRRLARNFDLVLIDACNPFGYGHVHPRGLLREPLAGLIRASAFILTRADQVSPPRLMEIRRTLGTFNPAAPIYHACHRLMGLRSPITPASRPPDINLAELAQRRFFAFAGIANPAGLHQQLGLLGGDYRGHHWLADHHTYSAADISDLHQRAHQSGADRLITTEKDWVKLSHFDQAMNGSPPIWRLEMQIKIRENSADLLRDIIATL